MNTMHHLNHAYFSRRFVLFGTFAALAACFGSALAHGPSPQRINEQIVVAVPPAKAWALVGDYAQFAAWNPALSSSSADKGNDVGSVRTLTFAKGGSVTEELDEHLAADMSLSYRSGRTIDLKVLPASSYSVRLRVVPDGSGSRIEWRCRAYRADTTNEPAEDLDDAAAMRALQDYIRPALAMAKKSLEQGL